MNNFILLLAKAKNKHNCSFIPVVTMVTQLLVGKVTWCLTSHLTITSWKLGNYMATKSARYYSIMHSSWLHIQYQTSSNCTLCRGTGRAISPCKHSYM